jgi:WhiB family transcriptional regulator, redox-sensing transcriptional regulator
MWWERANCLGEDVELFFPDRYTSPRYIQAAKNICHDCEVRIECLEVALETDSLGIWAGTDEKERFQIKIEAKR